MQEHAQSLLINTMAAPPLTSNNSVCVVFVVNSYRDSSERDVGDERDNFVQQGRDLARKLKEHTFSKNEA